MRVKIFFLCEKNISKFFFLTKNKIKNFTERKSDRRCNEHENVGENDRFSADFKAMSWTNSLWNNFTKNDNRKSGTDHSQYTAYQRIKKNCCCRIDQNIAQENCAKQEIASFTYWINSFGVCSIIGRSGFLNDDKIVWRQWHKTQIKTREKTR